MLKRFLFIPIFLVLVLLVTWISVSYNDKRDQAIVINFVIAKIEESRTFRCILYDRNGEELDLDNYVFYTGHYKVGDSLTKKANSRDLYCYRRDVYGKYKVFSIATQ